MKRRKWWFIGLGVALLAACVGVWKWSERPPYRFLNGAHLAGVMPGIMGGLGPAGGYTVIYVLETPFPEVVTRARQELEEQVLPVVDQRFYRRAALFVETDGESNVMICEVAPKVGVKPSIVAYIERRPNPFDRLRGWLQWGSKGARP